MKRYAILGVAHPFRGGIAQYTSALYLTLAAGHEARLFSLKRQYPGFLFPGKTQFDTSRAPLRVPNHPILEPMAPWTWSRAVREIASYRADVILVMWWNPFFAPMLSFIAARLKRTSSAAIAFLCHNVEPHESTVVDRWLLAMAYRQASHFLVQSEGELVRLHAFRPDAPAQVIFHPAYSFLRQQTRSLQEARAELVQDGLLDPAIGAGGKGQGQRHVMLFFGHIRHYKGLDVLLHALPEVRRRIQVELLIVGEFYESRTQYDTLIRTLGLDEAVRIVDRYVGNEEIGVFFEAADVVVLPYRSGTQSGVVPLAYLFERPVIVTRVGGIPEVVEEGRTGLLVDAEDSASLAAAIIRFFEEDLGTTFGPHLKPAADRLSWKALGVLIDEFLSPSAQGTTARDSTLQPMEIQ